MYLTKIASVFLSIWLVSSVAFSNGSVAPELPLLANAKSSVEYPVLRRIQDLTLDLQLLELTIKNRRDSNTEVKIISALREIEEQGVKITERFKAVRSTQLESLYQLMNLARRHGELLGVADAEWDELFDAVRDGSITAGTLTVHGRAGSMNLVSLTPLYIGKQLIWNVTLPSFDRKSFWVQARSRLRYLGAHSNPAIANQALEARVAEMNTSFFDAEKTTKEYFTTSYTKLYLAFETQRYAILQRIELARKALQELQKHSTAMGTPEEFSGLYNQILDNLFSYGVDISLSGSQQRDFAVKGFLFAESPERSQELLKKLKFTPSVASYNSPSS